MSRLFATIHREVAAAFLWFVRMAPGRIGDHLRMRRCPKLFANEPKRLWMDDGFWVRGGRNIVVGDDVRFGRMASLEAETGTIKIGAFTTINHGVWMGANGGEIEIGANVIMGPYIVLRAANHKFDEDMPVRLQGHIPGKIVIEENVLIGSHVTFLAGAHVGRNSVIGAGAVVRSAIPENSLAAGVPAKVIRSINRLSKDA